MEGHMVTRWSHAIDNSPQIPSEESTPDPVQTQNSRTSLMRRFGAIAPPAALILSMSTLTVITLLLVVTTVAQATPLSQQEVSPWSRWDSSPGISGGDQQVSYANFTRLDAMTPSQDRLDSTYVTSWMPQQ
jgi:hypothetical protein